MMLTGGDEDLADSSEETLVSFKHWMGCLWWVNRIGPSRSRALSEDLSDIFFEFKEYRELKQFDVSRCRIVLGPC